MMAKKPRKKAKKALTLEEQLERNEKELMEKIGKL